MLFDNTERRKERRYVIYHTIEYIIGTETSHEKAKGLTMNISYSGLCFYTQKLLYRGQEIKIKRSPTLSYQAAKVQWIQKAHGNYYKVGLSLLN